VAVFFVRQKRKKRSI